MTALIVAALGAGDLGAEVSLRLFSPSFSYTQAHFNADNGDAYTLSESVVEGDLVGLEARHDAFPWVGIGTVVFVRDDNFQLNSTHLSGSGTGGSITIKSESYGMLSAAPALQVLIYPIPGAEPLTPFLEARMEIYTFADSGLSGVSYDRFRPVFAAGVRGKANDTGYYWGARLFAAKRGYTGIFDDIAVPDPVIFGLQVDWIGIVF